MTTNTGSNRKPGTFVPGDKRINRKVRPKSFDQLRALAQMIAHETGATDADGTPQTKNENADIHAATFPIDLPSHFVETFTNSNELIYEPFCGTGTTIIACENLSRKCRAVEISPAYVAVALERWSQLTCKTPELLEA